MAPKILREEPEILKRHDEARSRSKEMTRPPVPRPLPPLPPARPPAAAPKMPKNPKKRADLPPKPSGKPSPKAPAAPSASSDLDPYDQDEQDDDYGPDDHGDTDRDPDDNEKSAGDAKRTLRYRIDNAEWYGDLIPDWLRGRKELTWTAKGVWAYLFRRLSKAEGFAFPKQETIATALGISLRAAKDAIKLLKDHRLITVASRPIKHGKWKTNRKKTAYLVVANHPWADGAKTRRPEVDPDDEDYE